ncbi:transport protein particle (TRAPP) subunit,putative [Trypanosoma brucei gambiense DAL972]|uniref:Transport protein particle (TRAPP) subunit,putative n=1 Tax=Trypanosoma brucei gambiense (strain MHOM/CI/86/DAL972) TaxID=679716 RepID=C9ZZ12_TRYB9|nr:transport protein particle (TRAPP) subunit,putative [Trypanosoma brucei gambiense DAL972]CBH14661.1 transport protein particle (TRAPP) subunit,putative [Trypanosoma brucei gambiense DAL972]|eukprot:XP_011776927.1 transport protein particle (TRAPP) subunit,putative [Trypanosoma brucei gambiense DAL972]
MLNRDGTRSNRSSVRLTSDEGKVSLSAFSFLFSELCTRAHSTPTKARDIEEIEQRLTSLGAIVGAKLMMLSSLKDPLELQRRPTTIDEALKLLQEKFWTRWFGKTANDLQQEGESTRYFLVDSNPMVLQHVYPSPEYMDSEGQWSINYASFMGGIVEGALRAVGFDADVLTYHHPEPDKPQQSIFAISFAQHVHDRERRIRD